MDKNAFQGIAKLLELSSDAPVEVAKPDPDISVKAGKAGKTEKAKKPVEEPDELVESDNEEEGDDEEEVQGLGEEEGEDEDEAGEDEDDGDEDEVGDEDESEDDDENEGSEESEESEGDEDEGEETEYSEKDLRKLTSFPKELRAGIAKLPKKDQSKLVAWVNQMNEEKRKVHADATSVQTEAKEAFGRAVKLRESLDADWKKVAELLGPAIKDGKLSKLADDDKKVLTDMIESHRRSVHQNFVSDMQADVDHRAKDAISDVRDFLAGMGKKPEVWMTRNEDDFHILLLSAMYLPKEKRAAILRKLRPIVENAGKAMAKKKARPRPAGSSTKRHDDDRFAAAKNILRLSKKE